MPKTVSSAMETHLLQEVTTLCTCWEIKRIDGRFFRFTDSSINLVVDGNTYRSDAGYTRSALSSTSDLSVDNLEVDGFYQDDAITNSDLRSGLFDFAEVRMFLVNHQDTTQQVKLRRGNLGEVQTQSIDEFKAELRSLAQSLQQNIGFLYQPTCRQNLGAGSINAQKSIERADRPFQCRFPIQPDLIRRNTGYTVGEFVRVPTLGPPTVRAVPVLDAGFEALTNWTTVSGDPALVTSRNGLSAFEGSNFLYGNTTASASGYVIRQDVDLTGISGYSQANLDAGDYVLHASIRISRPFNTTRDSGRIRIEALDSSGVEIQELWNSKFHVRKSGVWNFLTVDDKILPPNTTQLRIWVEGGSFEGSGVTEVGFDDLRVDILDNGSAIGAQASFENRIYECTTAGTTTGAQPVYDTTVGNTTTDGTAVFTAREAFMRHGVIATVTDTRTFTITATLPAGWTDDFLNGGSIIWETGNNAGKSMEIQDWVDSTNTISLFLEMPLTIQVNDRFRLFPGCDKRRATCRDKFVISGSTNFAQGNAKNFDGEPDLPGSDFVLTYPDAD